MSSIDAKQLYEWARIGNRNTLSSSWFDIEHVESENGRTILHAAAENGDPATVANAIRGVRLYYP